jgi:hypothetical protein
MNHYYLKDKQKLIPQTIQKIPFIKLIIQLMNYQQHQVN